MNLVKRILPHVVIVTSGVFLEFWIYNFSDLLSIKDFLFDHGTDWKYFLTFMTIGNIFLIFFCYVLAKRIENLSKTRINLFVTIVLVWVTSFIVTKFFYDWFLNFQYRLFWSVF